MKEINIYEQKTIYLREEVNKEIRLMAIEKGISQTKLIEDIFDKYFKKDRIRKRKIEEALKHFEEEN